MECFLGKVSAFPQLHHTLAQRSRPAEQQKKENVLYTFWFLTKQKYEHQTHCFQSMRIGLDLHGELNHIHKLFQLEIRTLDTS